MIKSRKENRKRVCCREFIMNRQGLNQIEFLKPADALRRADEFAAKQEDRDLNKRYKEATIDSMQRGKAADTYKLLSTLVDKVAKPFTDRASAEGWEEDKINKEWGKLINRPANSLLKVHLGQDFRYSKGRNGSLFGERSFSVTKKNVSEYKDQIPAAQYERIARDVKDQKRVTVTVANDDKGGPAIWSVKGDSKDYWKDSDALSDDYKNDQRVKGYSFVDMAGTNAKKTYIDAIGRNDYVGADQVLINTLNKMIDRDSVVREGEYARTIENLGLDSRMKGYAEKMASGGAGLTDSDRESLLSTIDILKEVARKQVVSARDYYIDQAEKRSLDSDSISNMFDLEPKQTFVELRNDLNKIAAKEEQLGRKLTIQERDYLLKGGK